MEASDCYIDIYPDGTVKYQINYQSRDNILNQLPCKINYEMYPFIRSICSITVFSSKFIKIRNILNWYLIFFKCYLDEGTRNMVFKWPLYNPCLRITNENSLLLIDGIRMNESFIEETHKSMYNFLN